ncbi:MAG TPA: pitrilysin family protein [Gemmatimonadaceae bacterium]|nr:pitrilysin family protein [Gemmatimonadaceae bacterium]
MMSPRLRALAIAAVGMLTVAASRPASPPDDDTVAFDVDGIRVILRQTDNNIVAANLYLLGGARQLTPQTAGTEVLLLEASERGTRRYPKEVLRRKMSGLGTAIVVDADKDWTMLGIRSTTEVFDSTWAIFADRLMNPLLLPAEVDIVRSQHMSAISQIRDDPDALSRYLADSLAFAGHPYAVPVGGTHGSMSQLTTATLREYQRTQIVKSRMLLVVVGDVDRPKLESLIRGSLAQLPAGSYRWTLPPPAPRGAASVVFEQRPLPTNYVIGYYAGPVANERDLQVLRIATSVLTGRMFADIRTRRNLTYDVHAPFVEHAATLGGLYISTVSPDVTLALMREHVTELQRELIDGEGLKRLSAQFVTEYLLDNETNAAQADFLARAELFRGDYRIAAGFVDELRAVTPQEVRAVAQKYMRGMRFAFVGDSTKVERRLLLGF